MRRHLSPHPARFQKIYTSACQTISTCLVACGIALLLSSPAHAQGGVPLVTVATDQSQLNLPNQFGIPAGSAINQAGDFAFIGNGESALFFRASGGSSVVRLLQRGDAAPNIPNSHVTGFSSLVSINSLKHIYFGISFSLADTTPHSAILIYDGTNYHTVVSTGEIAPAPDNIAYTSVTPGSINDAGDVNFAGTLNGKSSITYYIVPSGQPTAVRVASSDDPIPPACTWCSPPGGSAGSFFGGNPVSAFTLVGKLRTPRLNATGQMLLNLWGGLFIGSVNGISLVPVTSSGPCMATLRTVTNPQILWGGLLNNSGTVVYRVTSLAPAPGPGIVPLVSVEATCIVPPGAGSSSIIPIAPGIAAPQAIGGSLTSLYLWDLDDAGDVLLMSPIFGGTLTNYALLRYHSSGGQMDVVAYNNETAPGTGGKKFVGPPSPIVPSVPRPAFIDASISHDGQGRVSFSVSLGPSQYAIYQQSGAALPILLAMDGQSAPVAGGGTFAFSVVNTVEPALAVEALNNGSTLFSASIKGGTADFGEFVASGTTIQALVSTADSLPSGARTTILAAPPKAAGHFVSFAAQLAGGRLSLFVSDISSGTTTRVVSDGDSALAGAGAVASNFFMNENGQVAFQTYGPFGVAGFGVIRFLSGPSAWSSLFPGPCGTIFLWSTSSALSKVVGSGDSSPISGTPFSCVSLNSGPPSPLNGSGHLAFSGSLPETVSYPVPHVVRGLFLYSPGGPLKKIVATDDTLAFVGPNGLPVTSVPDLPVPLNSAGQVAFGAEAGSIGPFSPPPSRGFFLNTAGGAATKVMANGDAVPASSGTIFTEPHFISDLNDHGDLAFTAATSNALISSSADGIFFAPAGGAIQTVALDGGAAAVSGGGSFSLTLPLPLPPGSPPGSFTIGLSPFSNIALMNQESDVAFRAGITGNATTDSGYFRLLRNGASAGTMQPVVMQGQDVPGGGKFDTIPLPGNQDGEFALGVNGDLAFVNNFTDTAGTERGLFLARPDGTLLRVLATGDTVPGGGVLSGIRMSQDLAAGSAGTFAFWARISGGSSGEAIYATAVQPGTAGTTATLAGLQPPVIALQPVALTATVVRNSNVAAVTAPTGKVNFFDYGTLLGNGATLDSTTGKATMTTSSLVGGPHSLVAQYDGDANFAPADSLPVNTVVTGFALPPTGLAVTAGKSLQIPLVLYASAGSSFNFMLSCSGLPVKASCAFDHNQVAPGPSGTPIMVTLSTMANSNALPHRPRKGPRPLGLLELSAILSVLLAAAMTKLKLAPGRRLAFGMCIAAFGLLALMAGCGTVGSGSSLGPSGTPPGLAAITVTGTSGTTTVSTVVSVTVQ